MCGAQFSAKFGRRDGDEQLVGVVRIVAEAVIQIVIGNAGACAERHAALAVGKEVAPLVVVVLGDGEVGMQHQPVNEVGKLAHAAAYGLGGLAVFNVEPRLIALGGGVSPHEPPERKGFPRADEDAAHLRCRQCQIVRLVELQLRVYPR